MATEDCDKPPTTQQIEDVRKEAKNKVEEEGKEAFHFKDVEKLLSNDDYVARFWIHAFFIPGERIENTVNLVMNTFRWRKQFGVHDITEELLDKGLKEKGTLYSHNRDIEGSKILVFCVRKHIKDVKNMQNMKEFFVYMLDRIEKEEKGKKITIIFDSESAGLANIDIEIVRFVIQVLISYYPNFINKIIVYEMPWILNSAWKIIKSLLPAPAVARIKFCTKSTLDQYISPEHMLCEWGGHDSWIYSWEPEEKENSDELDHIGQSEVVKIAPEKVVMFSSKDNDSLEAKVLIQNVSSDYLAFKVKSTFPTLFLVKPHTAVLVPNQEVLVRIQTHHRQTRQGKIQAQQFQINYFTMEEKLEQHKLSSLFSNSAKTCSIILSCGLDTSVSELVTADTPGVVNNIQNKTRVLSDRVLFLEEKLFYVQQLFLVQGVLIVVYLLYRWMWSDYGVMIEEAGS